MFDTFTINGSPQQQQNTLNVEILFLFVENNERKTFRHAKVFDCRISFARKLIWIRGEGTPTRGVLS